MHAVLYCLQASQGLAGGAGAGMGAGTALVGGIQLGALPLPGTLPGATHQTSSGRTVIRSQRAQQHSLQARGGARSVQSVAAAAAAAGKSSASPYSLAGH